MRAIDRDMSFAAEWLLESQAGSSDKGYRAYYDLDGGWSNSYPETTGYIIPTMAKLGMVFGRRFTQSAIQAADWLVDIQHKNGHYQGGLIGEKKHPVVFNTGQIIFGLSAAYKITKDKKYAYSINKTLDWLVNVQDDDGAWRRFLTKKGTGEFHIYKTRVAWGILEGASTLKERNYYKAAIANFDFAAKFQKRNGWFDKTDLKEETNDQPLLHFLAYTIEGFLEGGMFLKNKRYVNIAKKTADALLMLQEKDGSLKGRYDSEWQPTVKWSCLTAVAQLAGIWLRFYRICGQKKYLKGGMRANNFLARTQIKGCDDPGIRGGIAGSRPLMGGYEGNRYLSWATKFFIDSLILKRENNRQALRTEFPG
jgi:hypothetical protein